MDIHWTIQLVSSIVYIIILTIAIVEVGSFLVKVVTKVAKHEELYRAILKNLPPTIVAVDWYANKIMYINNISACLLRTDSNKDPLQMTPEEIFPFINEQQWEEIKASVKQNKLLKMVVPVDCSMTAQLIVSCLDIRSKKVVIYAIRQIKPRVEGEPELRSKYEALFNAIPTPLILSSREGQILLVNPAMCLFTQFTKEEIENKTHILQFVADEDKDRVATYLQNRSAEGGLKQYSYTFSLIKKDQSKWLCSAKVSNVPDSSEYIASVIEIEYLHEGKELV